MSDVEYKVVFTENAEIEMEDKDGDRELVTRDAWTLIEFYMGELHAVWYLNTKDDAEELKQLKLDEEELKQLKKKLPPSETESTKTIYELSKTPDDRHTDSSRVDDKDYDIEVYGRIEVLSSYSPKHKTWALLIRADKSDYLFTHYSCSEEIRLSVVTVAQLMAEALQDGKTIAGKDRLYRDIFMNSDGTWTVIITVDNPSDSDDDFQPIFCTCSCESMMKDEVVGLILRMAAVLQNLTSREFEVNDTEG